LELAYSGLVAHDGEFIVPPLSDDERNIDYK
jgi:hypothetical protein